MATLPYYREFLKDSVTVTNFAAPTYRLVSAVGRLASIERALAETGHLEYTAELKETASDVLMILVHLMALYNARSNENWPAPSLTTVGEGRVYTEILRELPKLMDLALFSDGLRHDACAKTIRARTSNASRTIGKSLVIFSNLCDRYGLDLSYLADLGISRLENARAKTAA